MQLAGKLAGIFSSGTVLIVGSIVLLRSMSLDFDTVFYACKLSLVGAVVAGFLGYTTGKTFEKAGQVRTPHGSFGKNSNILIDDILDNNLEEPDFKEEVKQTGVTE